MTPTGSEQARQYSSFCDPAACAAFFHALGPDFDDLAAVVSAWPTLPVEVRADILAVVRQAHADTPTGSTGR